MKYETILVCLIIMFFFIFFAGIMLVYDMHWVLNGKFVYLYSDCIIVTILLIFYSLFVC